MVKFTMDDIQRTMQKKQQIVNMSIIAHVDHGKTTLSDNLIKKFGIASGGMFMDTRKDEKEQGITIKATSVSMYFETKAEQLLPEVRQRIDEAELMESSSSGASSSSNNQESEIVLESETVEQVQQEEQQVEETVESSSSSEVVETETGDKDKEYQFLINLIDSPGHVDFSSEVTAALRLTDGALVVVDAVDGVCVQTETVLRQAIQEGIVPVLMINKVDKAIDALQLSPEDLFTTLKKAVESVNAVIATYDSGALGRDLQVDPTKGNVAFGSGLFGWGFTLRTWAKYYSKKLGADEDSLMTKLWDQHWDNSKKKFKKKSGKNTTPAFVKFVIEPLYKVFRGASDSTYDAKEERTEYMEYIAESFDVTFKSKDNADELFGKELMALVMPRVWPVAATVLDMAINHLPTPAQAQKYRALGLYNGPADDECAQSMQECDPNGPLMFYVSKLVPDKESRFIAFGRVFGGTLKAGKSVRIMGPDYVPGSKKDLFVKKINRVVLMMGSKHEQIDECPAGNICGIFGIDQYLVKTGTLSTHEDAYTIKSMKFSVSPVVRKTVEPKNPQNIQKMVEALKLLEHSDPCIEIKKEESGSFVVAGAGELQLEVFMRDLQAFCGFELNIGDPVVPLRETVISSTEEPCLAKSKNKLNRLFMTVEPMGEELNVEIDEGIIGEIKDEKERNRYMASKFDWNPNDCKKIWAFGPETVGPNVLIDQTSGQSNMRDIKDTCVAAFQWASSEGPLAEESMRGVKYNIVDALLHQDSVHRGGNEIIPCTRRVMHGTVLASQPRLMEPVFLVDISAPETALGGIYSTVARRQGEIISEENKLGTPLYIMRAYLPVAQSFGFTEDLREATHGTAFPQMVFDHWTILENEDPFDSSTRSFQMIADTRERKGLNPKIKTSDEYLDRL